MWETISVILSQPFKYIYLFFKLFHCGHNWKIIKEVDVYSIDSWGDRIGSCPTAHDYILQCENCGKIKSKRT